MGDLRKEEQDIINKFLEIRGQIELWGKFVDDSLMKILSKFTEGKRLQIVPKHRVKDVNSYMIKAIYGRGYKDPLLETEDKVGTRVVFLTSVDVVKFKIEIENAEYWNSKIGKDFRNDFYDKPEVFGYQSLHLIVSPKEGYPEDTNLHPYLTCEIQLRTLLQHTYAEIAHDSAYKGPYKGDREILRVLAKSMALMETTDDHFCRIFEMMLEPNRTSKIYLRELTQMFKAFVPEYEYSPEYAELNDTLMGLLAKKDISIEILTDFVNNNNKFLRGGILPKNGLLLQQPTILLVAFYLKKYQSFLKREWPLSHEALLKVFQSFGVADAVYY